MRYAVAHNTSRFIAALALVGLLAIAPARPVHATAPTNGGVRIAPAAIRLELPKGVDAAHATINISNTYAANISLQFAVTRAPQNARGSVDPTTLIALNTSQVTIAPRQTATVTLTLHDTQALAPGSQSAELTVTQQIAATTGVGVQPAVRLPITIIKDDGAVTSLSITNIDSSRFIMQPPHTVTVTARNTGNVVTIPRGIVTIRDPRGMVIGQGAINTASAAIEPGKELHIPVSITNLSSMILPGPYHITALYGLGGDASQLSLQATAVYIAWWHIALIIGGGIGVFLAVRYIRRFIRLLYMRHKKPTPPTPPPPVKRRILIGRNA